MVCVRSLKDARFKMKIRDILMAQKQPLQAQVRYYARNYGGPNDRVKSISCLNEIKLN